LGDYRLFPNHRVNKDGSRVVYHFGIEGVGSISLEKEHGSREYLPPRYAKIVTEGIEALLTHIEQSPEAAKELTSEDEGESAERKTGAIYDGSEKGDAIAGHEGPGALPQPKLPDGDS
jgi:hypothetical protein